MKRALVILAAIVAMGVVVGCGSNGTTVVNAPAKKDCKPKHQLKTAHAGQLSIAGYFDMPYLSARDGRVGGIDGAVLDGIARLECLKLNVTNIPAAGALTAVSSGRVDVAAGGWAKTAERGKQVGQTIPTYYDYFAIVSKDGISSVAALKGKTIALTAGYLFVSDFQKRFGDKVKVFQTTDASLQEILDGRADATVLGNAEARYYGRLKGLKVAPIPPNDQAPASVLTGISYDLPHTPHDAQLTTALDEDVATLRSDGTIRNALTQAGVTDEAAFTGRR